MATSRTGTAQWKRVRREALAEAQASGITVCPLCHRLLDYDRSLLPASAEVDHIVPHHKGGLDTRENVRILCRDCNGKRLSREKISPPPVAPLPTSRRW